MPHVRDIEEAVELRNRYRMEGLAVGLCHGCFDVLHYGHVYHLQKASEQVDRLFVSITADHYVKKGPGRPVFNEIMRARVVAALVYCDHSVISGGETSAYVIERLRPDVYFKGFDYQNYNDPRFIHEVELVTAIGGRVHLTDGAHFDSTTRIVDMLRNHMWVRAYEDRRASP